MPREHQANHNGRRTKREILRSVRSRSRRGAPFDAESAKDEPPANRGPSMRQRGEPRSLHRVTGELSWRCAKRRARRSSARRRRSDSPSRDARSRDTGRTGATRSPASPARGRAAGGSRAASRSRSRSPTSGSSSPVSPKPRDRRILELRQAVDASIRDVRTRGHDRPGLPRKDAEWNIRSSSVEQRTRRSAGFAKDERSELRSIRLLPRKALSQAAAEPSRQAVEA